MRTTTGNYFMTASRLGLGIVALMLAAGTAGAQQVYQGSNGFAPDSIMAPAAAAYAQNQQREIETAETNLNLAVNGQHFQYSENLTPGDSENGEMPGFTIGASYLQPGLVWPVKADLYTSLSYQFNAGNVAYRGTQENLITGATAPFNTTDRAVMNRIEGRFGMGLNVGHGVMVIPFLAGGYQSWNRNVDSNGVYYGDEEYSAALLGGGVRVDAALTPTLVAYGEGEVLGILVGNVTNNDANFSHGMGGSAEERLSAGLDQAVSGPFHVFANGYWEHFNWAGNKPTDSSIVQLAGSYYYLYEPLSTTSEFGLNVGASYAF